MALFNKKSKGNIYDMIPKKKENVDSKKTEEEKTILIIKRKKWIDKIFQKIFNTPKKTTLDLDQLGSFVWKQCNGKKTIGDIAQKLKKNFPEEASPIEGRLITFIKILKNNGLIKLKPKDK